MLVKVWNENRFPFSQFFRERTVTIPAGGFVEMEEDEAWDFHGSYSPVKRDGDNQPLAESFKMLRIETPPKAAPKKPSFMCHKCSVEFPSAVALENHIDARHLDDLVDEDVAAARRVARARKKPAEVTEDGA